MTHMIDILCYRVRRCDSHERHVEIKDYDVRSDATEDRNHGKNGKSKARTTSLIRERKNVQQHCFRVKTISMQKTQFICENVANPCLNKVTVEVPPARKTNSR